MKIKTITSEELQKLCDEHWEYIEILLATAGTKEKDIKVIGFHYKSAMAHGFKHGVQWIEKQIKETP